MTKKKAYSLKLFLMVLPFIVLVMLFCYYPLYGWLYAFYDYKPPKTLANSAFVGFKWFKSLVSSDVKIKQIIQVLKNTFAMSGLTLGTSWLPMLFAVFLNEIRGVKFRKFVQTVTTLPNFVSWVMVYSIAFSLFNSTGMMNSLLMKMGVISTPILFLQSSEHVWFTQWLWLTWKNLGWAAIMYIAAISSIDDEMIQAARVDGATRMQIIWHITIPSLLPTYFVLLVLNVANFLNNGMEQYYVFQNAFNKDYIQVLDLYVYNMAMGSGGYSVSVAISMLKSLVSLVLLFIVNRASKTIRGESIL
ncbi:MULTISPECIES: ABC transporter permease subunit [unclassified Butyrivibrio]|uniref:ABC transporter permease subunit n=1 Tax=unclassified Butyrivibrio TaxID=2639466 RepID=UPI0003B50764|nr:MULTISPECIES: ABC transporter permease subunit [unclassified Butyrivibrio]SEK92189.1 putative aldouronate transport system permease protein [Butyrivibrio sp. ob235]